jgi:hemolysin activation/secretion protein
MLSNLWHHLVKVYLHFIADQPIQKDHPSTMKPFIAGTLSVLGLMFLCGAIVQAAGLPGTVQPGQIEQQFQLEPKMRADQPGRIAVPEADQPMPSNAKDVRFKLIRLVIEGATVYSEKDLLSNYRSRLDGEVSLADIYQIASAMTAKYRNDGYILSQVVVPAQSVEGGRVRLRVMEGYITSVTIEGVDGDRRKLAQRYADKIRQSRPLKNSVLERYLLLMNDLPGAIARAAIKPSQKESGASEMTVQFSQSKVQGGLSLDNRGGESLGPWRISGDIGLNSVFGLQESTTLRLVSSGNEKMTFVSLAHEEKIGSEGGNLNLSFSTVNAKPKEMTFIPLNLETSSQTAVLAYSHPLIRSRSQNLSLRGGLTVHEGKTEIFSVEDTRDSTHALKIGATYDLADSWYGTNLIDVELSQGIIGLGSSSNHDRMLSRFNGRVDFTKATLYAARLQTLLPRWSFLAAVNAQYAFTDLLSSELYSFGGEQFGRGYDPSEMVGDHGVGMKLELRYTDTFSGRLAFSYTGYAFYDAGIVYQRSPGGLADSDSAASAGLGLRMTLGRYASCYAELAKPLTRDVSAEGNRDMRSYAGVSIRF